MRQHILLVLPCSGRIDQDSGVLALYAAPTGALIILLEGGKEVSKLQNKVAIVTGASKGIGAGIAKGLGAAGAAVVESEFYRHYSVNVLGPILTVQEALKYFGPDGGSVINISSIDTPILDPLGQEAKEYFTSLIPRGTMERPEEIATVALFL
jgi:hypothetical protein